MSGVCSEAELSPFADYVLPNVADLPPLPASHSDGMLRIRLIPKPIGYKA
jgi:hypothetical protein